MHGSLLNRYRPFHVRQQDQSDCGVACMAMILKSLGGNASLEYLRELTGTSSTGTTLLGLHQASSPLGLETGAYEATLEQLKETPHPAILHVLIDKRLLHYVVCWGWDESQKSFLIADPAHETKWMKEAELEALWQSKALLLIEGTKEHFEVQDDQQQAKRQWFWQLIEEDISILLVALFLGIILSVLGLSLSVFSQRLLDEILPSGDSQRLFAGIGVLTLLLLAKGMLSYVRQTFL
ncbi:MAG: cysteine peptidase family C39 domain-containing protein, partial [Bacteroidota bacterium]